MRIVTLLALFVVNFSGLLAQADSARWYFTLSNGEPRLKEDNQLIIAVDLPEEWGMYSSDFQSNTIGPTPTIFLIEKPIEYVALDAMHPIKPIQVNEPSFDLKYSYFTSNAEFRQCIQLVNNQTKIKGVIKGQFFHLRTGKTVDFEKNFNLTINIESTN